MKSIGTRFLLFVLLLAIAFSGVIFYQTWSLTCAHVEELTTRQAELALEFDLAIRAYIGESVRPVVEARVEPDEFIPEAMSTSFVARSVFDKVRERFPDYVLKFSSDNPRNPANAACPEELEILEYFRNHPEATKWVGKIRLNGGEYLGYFSPRRMEESCLRCHGRPKDAPKDMLARYGSKRGFYWPVGEVIATDTVAIPMDKVRAAITTETLTRLGTTAVWLVLFLGLMFVAFRAFVTRRLAAITDHFRRATEQPGEMPLASIAVTGRDEISILAASFNTLAARQQALQSSLERRVKERTAELETEVEQRKRTEEALRQSEQQYRRIFESVTDCLLVIDLDGKLAEANPTACRTYGYTREEMLGLCGKDFVHPDYYHLFEDFKRQLRTADHFYAESVDIRKDGSTFDIEVRGTTFDFKGEPHLLAVVRDITQRKRAEEALNRLNRELEQRVARRTAQLQNELEERKRVEKDRQRIIEELEVKNTELERFAYTVSHDLKSPLITIKGYVGLLAEDIERGHAAQIENDLARISGAADNMYDLLNDVLQLSRIGRQANPPASIPMRDLVHEALQLVAGSITQRGVQVRIEPDLPVLYGDHSRLREVLQNLIENAVRYMGDQPDPVIEIGARQEQDRIICHVRDNGIGIDPRYQKKVFGLFDKLDPNSEGTGVGLALVKRIVEVHNGQVWIRSKGTGHGSTFYFAIPSKT